MTLFICTIQGRCHVKKNTQRTVGIGRGKRVIYSPRYLAWEFDAVMAMRKAHKGEPIGEPMKLVIRFYFKDRQAEADTSNLLEGPQDCLTKSGVIVDDKLIKKIEAEKFFGHEPRVEIEIWKHEQ